MGYCLRIVLVSSAILLLLSGILFSQPGPDSYIGIYTTNHTGSFPMVNSYCPFEGNFARVEVWIICLPSDNGQIAAEFMVEYPGNVIRSTTTFNEELISMSLGTLEAGISIIYHECQTERNYPIHQTLWITSHDISYVTIVPHPDGRDQIIYANCLVNYPIEECFLFHRITLNYRSDYYGCTEVDEVIGTECSSWGVIKKLFDE